MTELFDAYPDTYEAEVQNSISFSGLPHDFFMKAKARLLERHLDARLPSAAATSLLDVGCGIGRMHPWLKTIVGDLSGTDPSGGSLERARIENAGVSYRAGNGGVLPYEDGCFDAAVAICVLHHVAPLEWPTFLSEMRRVVRPGGVVALIEHNPWNPGTRLAVARCPFDADATLVTRRRAERLFADAGLHRIESEFFLLFPSENHMLARVERSFRNWPVGAQYATIGTTPS